MSYKVRIVKNDTKEEQLYHCILDWHESSLFWWQEGNMSCDCNREMSFLRAAGATEEIIDSIKIECGDNRYSILEIILEDGIHIKVDED